MDSLYQNCVSEFDLDFLNPTAGASPATTTPISQLRQRMAHIKGKCKALGSLLNKAREDDEELQKIKEERRKDKIIIDEQNEGLKKMFEERNLYSKQATEYFKVINFQKEKIKAIEAQNYEVKVKTNLLKSYSDQVQGFKLEKEAWLKETEELKSKMLKDRYDFGKIIDYVIYPNIPQLQLGKNTKKWAVPILKKIRPNKFKNDILEHISCKTSNMPTSPVNLMQQVQKPPVDTEITDDSKLDEAILDDVELQGNGSILNRNLSLDFDFVGSVDTGRGSSLAFSDGDKSYHSPDYYMNDSPLCTGPILCSKCNVLKSNVSTSPIPQETFDVAISSVTNTYTSPIPDQNLKDFKTYDDDILNVRCTNSEKSDDIVSSDKQDNLTNQVLDDLDINSCKRDVCTSLLTSQIFDVDIETPNADNSPEKQYNAVSKVIDHSNFNQATNTWKKDACINPMPSNNVYAAEKSDFSPEKQYKITSKALEGQSNIILTIPTCIDDDIVHILPANGNDHGDTASNITSNRYEDKNNISRPATPSNTYEVQINIGNPVILNDSDEDTEINQINIISRNELPATSKPVVLINNSSSLASPVEVDFTTVQYDDHDKSSITYNNISGKEFPTNLQDETQDTDLKLDRNKIQEKECLELNNSYNFSNNDHDYFSISHNNVSGKEFPANLQDETQDTDLKLDRNKMLEKECLELNNSHNFSKDDHDKSSTSYNNISGKELPEKLQDGTPDAKLEVGRNKIQEQECLELNNSYNFSNEVDTDNEIESYLNTMKLTFPLLTPIPPTPPRETTPLPGLKFNDKNTLVHQPSVDIVLNPKRVDIDEHSPKHLSKISCKLAVVQYIHHLIPNKEDTSYGNAQELFSYNAATPTKILQVNDPEIVKNVDMVFNKICDDINDHIVKYLSKDTKEAVTHLISNIEHTSHEKTQNTYSFNEDVESNRNTSHVMNSDSCLTLSTKETDNALIENEVSALDDDADVQQDLEQTTGNESNDNEKEEKNQTSEDLYTVQKNTLESFSNNDKNTESIDMQTNSGMKDLLVFEHLELKTSKENNINETGEICKELSPKEKLLNETGKKKKISKLQKLRLKMGPKSKIKNEQPAKKLRFKPTPVIITPVKKKVAESDSAASLNDKRVYENAVKVIAASKYKWLLTKEPKIYLEDCAIAMRKGLQKSASNNGTNEKTSNNTSKSLSPPETANAANGIKSKKRNLLLDFENVMIVPENLQETRKPPQEIVPEKPVACKKICVSQSPEASRGAMRSSDANRFVLHNEKNTYKRNRTISDRKRLEENLRDEPATIQGTKSKNVDLLLHSSQSFDKTDSDVLTTKRDTELNESMLFSETNKAKRRRISHFSSPNLFGNSNNNTKQNEMPDNHIETNQKIDSCDRIQTDRRRTVSSSNTRHNNNEVDNTVELDNNVNKEATKRLSTVIRRDSNNKLGSTALESLFTNIKNDDSPSKANRLISSDERSDNNAECKTNDAEISDALVSPKRVLRSANKNNKSNGLEIDGIVPLTNTKYLEGFRSNIYKDPNQSRKNDNRAVYTSPERNHRKTDNRIEAQSLPVSGFVSQKNHDTAVSYADLSLFLNDDNNEQEQNKKRDEPVNECGKNVLCRMIEKYGVQIIRYSAKKVPETKITEICNKLEKSVSHIIELPHEQCLGAMKKLVIDIRSLNAKHFLHGFIKYLKNPQRKFELFSKSYAPPAPPMTKTEQILLYIIDELQKDYNYRNIVRKILLNIEYTLFALNQSPEFKVVESMSHFYALVCRYYQQISKLRAFLVDALYCLQYKSINLVSHCLDVWMLTLPLGHLGLAKTPLVICVVYLLHFYKCEDKFHRIQELRHTLRRKFNYDFNDWNETKILDLFWTTIKEVRDDRSEKQTLRLALIVLAKRNGPKWCQKHIIKDMLQPIIADPSTPDVAKQFCVSMLGPLVKPYLNEMKVHSEMIIDYLLDMLEQKHPPKMQEAIISSLICVNKNNTRIIQFLVKWDPKNVSPEFELMFKDFVRTKTVRTWKTVLSQIEC